MPYLHELLPLISLPPMHDWVALTLPLHGNVTGITRINMQNLQEMDCNYSPLVTLPWDELVNLSLLQITGCAFTTLELWRTPNLEEVYAEYNSDLVSVDAHDNTVINGISVSGCVSLTTMDVSGCTNLNEIYADSCALGQAMIDTILTDLVTNGVSSGYLQINGPGNASPSNPDGVAHKNILLGRGWTIYSN